MDSLDSHCSPSQPSAGHTYPDLMRMKGDTILPAYEAMADELDQSTLSNEHPKESPLLVALPLRLRGTPTAPANFDMPSASDDWGEETLQSLGIDTESQTTTTESEDMETCELLPGVPPKLAAELDRSVSSSGMRSLQEGLSPPPVFGDNHSFFQGPKCSGLLGHDDSSQQSQRFTESGEAPPFRILHNPWLTSNARKPMQQEQPQVLIEPWSTSPEVSEQTLKDAGFAGGWPGSGSMRRQQADIKRAESTMHQPTALQHESAAAQRIPYQVNALNPAKIQRQAIEGDIWRPDLYPVVNPVSQVQWGAPTNGANGRAERKKILQDYGRQLMLLEQENKKRLLMARQEQDATVRRSGGQNGINGPASPQHHAPQTNLHQQPKPELQSIREQRQWFQARTQQHLQDLPTSAAQKYGGIAAAVPPSVRLECEQRASSMAQEHISMDYIIKRGPHAQDPKGVSTDVPRNSAQVQFLHSSLNGSPPTPSRDCSRQSDKAVAANPQTPENQYDDPHLQQQQQQQQQVDVSSQPTQDLPSGRQLDNVAEPHPLPLRPRTRSSPKARTKTLESSKLAEPYRSREQKRQSQQQAGHQSGGSQIRKYRSMAANAFNQDRERRVKKNIKLSAALEPSFKEAQDKLLEIAEKQVRYVRYAGFCDAVNRLRDQQRKRFDEAVGREGEGEGERFGRFKEVDVGGDEMGEEGGDEMEVEDENMMETEDENATVDYTSPPHSDDGDREWDRMDETNASSGEEWTEIDGGVLRSES